MYADPGVGDPNESWYALLRFTQADPATILDCGYVVDDGEPGGWTYEVNCDDQTFSVDGDERVTWPWSTLPTDRDFLAIEHRLDPDTSGDRPLERSHRAPDLGAGRLSG